MKKFILYIFIIIGLFGCEMVLENVPVPQIPVKAVVYGNIDVDASYNTIKITKSKPILNNSTSSEFEAISDAQVTLVSGVNSYTFTFNAPNGVYEYTGIMDFSNDKAELEVVTADIGTVTSKVDVPDALSSYTIQIDSVDREWEVEYSVLFTLPAKTTSEFYRLEGFSAYATDTFPAWSSKEYHTNKDNLIEELKMKSTFYKWKDENGKNADLYINYTRISEEHYNYGKALENYEPNNPFSEPTPLPSNIDGGLGIFTLSRTEIVKIN